MLYNKARGDFMRYGFLFLVLCFILIFFCAGCDDFHNAIFEEENIDIPEEKYDADRFFVKEEAEPECYSYTLCYEHADGEVTKIVDFGAENKNFVIVDDRIYYGSGNIVSIDFTGQDRKTFSDPDIGFEDVLRYEDGCVLPQRKNGRDIW